MPAIGRGGGGLRKLSIVMRGDHFNEKTFKGGSAKFHRVSPKSSDWAPAFGTKPSGIVRATSLSYDSVFTHSRGTQMTKAMAPTLVSLTKEVNWNSFLRGYQHGCLYVVSNLIYARKITRQWKSNSIGQKTGNLLLWISNTIVVGYNWTQKTSPVCRPSTSTPQTVGSWFRYWGQITKTRAPKWENEKEHCKKKWQHQKLLLINFYFYGHKWEFMSSKQYNTI